MDPRFQTSFIPKKPVLNSTGSASKTINLFTLIGTLLFIMTVALAVGVYFYNSFVIKQIVESKKTLELAKDAFNPDLINKIVGLNKKIEASRGLLSGHLAMSYYFDTIGRLTLKNVRFRDFAFEFLSKDKVTLSMKGQAQSFESVALQSDALNAEKTLKDAVISSFALNSDGTVSFDVTASIVPTSVIYQDIIKAQNQNIEATKEIPEEETEVVNTELINP
jgi:hypothetical protein